MSSALRRGFGGGHDLADELTRLHQLIQMAVKVFSVT